ncbi:MAG: two pore domain potassium channel family protein [Gammaproteobacteria bacterium]|nr:two pore domain potassium channel family protein [Gammaproteobacteria bacterium]
MLTTLSTTALLALSAVLLHYEALLRMSSATARHMLVPRLAVALGLCGALITHIIEICVFALGYDLLAGVEHVGRVAGGTMRHFSDYAYFSFSTYTGLGYGDLTPQGPLRFVAAVESLTGLVLVAWTASFLFMQMQRYWDQPPRLLPVSLRGNDRVTPVAPKRWRVPRGQASAGIE